MDPFTLILIVGAVWVFLLNLSSQKDESEIQEDEDRQLTETQRRWRQMWKEDAAQKENDFLMQEAQKLQERADQVEDPVVIHPEPGESREIERVDIEKYRRLYDDIHAHRAEARKYLIENMRRPSFYGWINYRFFEQKDNHIEIHYYWMMLIGTIIAFITAIIFPGGMSFLILLCWASSVEFNSYHQSLLLEVIKSPEFLEKYRDTIPDSLRKLIEEEELEQAQQENRDSNGE